MAEFGFWSCVTSMKFWRSHGSDHKLQHSEVASIHRLTCSTWMVNLVSSKGRSTCTQWRCQWAWARYHYCLLGSTLTWQINNVQIHKNTPYLGQIRFLWVVKQVQHTGTKIRKINRHRAPDWLSWLGVWLLISAQVMISQFVGLSPVSGSVLTAQSLPGILSLSLSLSAPLPLFLSKKISKLFFLIFFLTFIYLFLRQRETEHERGRVRERETQNLKQAPGSELSAQSPTRGLNSRTARSWPEPKSDA